jgi:hypothetical protein
LATLAPELQGELYISHLLIFISAITHGLGTVAKPYAMSQVILHIATIMLQQEILKMLIPAEQVISTL